MSRHVQDELKHWRKESYRTLEDAEQATGQPWASSSWKEESAQAQVDTLAVCFIAFAALAVSLYLLRT